MKQLAIIEIKRKENGECDDNCPRAGTNESCPFGYKEEECHTAEIEVGDILNALLKCIRNEKDFSDKLLNHLTDIKNK